MSITARACISRFGRALTGLETSAIRRNTAVTPFKFQSRGFLLQPFKSMFARSKKEVEERSKMSPEGIHGERMLYEGNSSSTVRAMFAAGAVNMMYWTHHLVQCYVYQDVIIQGIDLGGQPAWAFFGFAGTGLIFFCNREYATHAAHTVYETTDGERIGFQMYNMIGLPGRKIEANIGNVRLANTAAWNLGSDSFVPLRVVGINNNVLLDKDGIYYANGRLKELLRAGGNGQPGSKQAVFIRSENVKKGTWKHVKAEEKKSQRKYLKGEDKSS